MSLKKGVTTKTVCIGLALNLAFNQAAFGTPPPPVQGVQPSASQFASPGFLRELTPFAVISDFYLPQEKPFNLIDDLLTDQKIPLVIYLQDAHGNLSAQKNIAETIRLFSKRAGLKEPWIALEGTEAGEIDHGVLSLFPGRQIRSRVAEYFLRRGEMDGADYFTARYNQKARHFGVDAEELTQKHRESYREFITEKSGAEWAIARLSKACDFLKDKIYSGDLAKLDRFVKHYETNRNYIHKYIPALLELAKRHGIALEKYPALARLGGASLLDELERLEGELWKKLLFYREAQEARAIDRAVQFYRKLFNFSLLPGDYADYSENLNPYDLDSLKQKFDHYAFLLRPEGRLPTDREIGILKRAAAPAFLFYQTAHERNEPLTSNLLALLEKNRDRKLFLVSGGFHEGEIVSRLKAERIPFVIVAPRISGEEGTENYWRLLGGESSPSELETLLASHYKLPKRYSDLAFQREVAFLLAAASGADRPLLDKYVGRLGEMRASSLLGTWRRNLTPYGQGWVGYDADPAAQGPELVLYAGNGGGETAEPRAVAPIDLSGYVEREEAFLEDGWKIAIYGRSEVRKIQEVALNPAEIGNIRGTPSDQFEQWISETSRRLSEATNRAYGKIVSSSKRIKKLLINGFRQMGEDDAAHVTKIHNSSRNGGSMSVVFTDQPGAQMKLIGNKLPISVKILQIFEEIKPGLGDVITTLAIRNYFIGDAVYSESDSANRKSRMNQRFIEAVLRGLDDRNDHEKTGLEEVGENKRRLFIDKLTAVVTSEKEPPPYLVDLTRALVLAGTDLPSWQKTVASTPKGNPRRENIEKRPVTIGPDREYPGGRYELKEKLGSGGFGTVWKARDLKWDRDVAVKILHKEYANDEEAQIRRMREFAALGDLSGHPHMVSVHEPYNLDKEGNFVDKSKDAFYVMDLIEGEPLDKILKREKRLDPKRAVAIASQIAEGLKAMHDKGYVYRDLKPSNTMVRLDPKTGDVIYVWLLDFTLMTKRGVNPKFATDRTTGTVGTPPYIAPETWWVSILPGPWVDRYALGVTLFQMLTGRTPTDPQGTGDQALIARNAMTGNYPDPTTLGVTVDPELMSLVWKLLAQPISDLPKEEVDKYLDDLLNFPSVRLRDKQNGILSVPGDPAVKAKFKEEVKRKIKSGEILSRPPIDETIRQLNAWRERHNGNGANVAAVQGKELLR
jgi:serine/threonine protein kinase